MNIDQWQDSGNYFTFNEQTIFYKDSQDPEQFEDKPALLLIHGFPTSSWDWVKVWPSFAQHFRVVALDLLGFGFSDKPFKNYLITEQADICQSLLSKLNIKDYHLIAHDFGATVAQELLARNSQTPQILTCNLANAGLFPESHHQLPIQTLLVGPLGRFIALFNSEKKLKKSMDNICFIPLTAEEIHSYWQLICHNQGNRIIYKLIRYITQRKKNRERWVNALIGTKVPLQFINGVLDPISGEHMALRYEELVPNPMVTRLHQVGHYPQLESPSIFSKTCLRFIDAQSPAK